MRKPIGLALKIVEEGDIIYKCYYDRETQEGSNLALDNMAGTLMMDFPSTPKARRGTALFSKGRRGGQDRKRLTLRII